MCTHVSNFACIFFSAGKRESIGGGNPVGNWPSSTGGPVRPLNSTVGYGVAAGGANMTPDDPAPDEEFALAFAQKAQVRLVDDVGFSLGRAE